MLRELAGAEHAEKGCEGAIACRPAAGAKVKRPAIADRVRECVLSARADRDATARAGDDDRHRDDADRSGRCRTVVSLQNATGNHEAEHSQPRDEWPAATIRSRELRHDDALDGGGGGAEILRGTQIRPRHSSDSDSY